MYEIIYKCNSTNNKNVRENELKILRKFEEGLYFEFGEDEKNIKKRFYTDLETLNNDYEALLKLKEKENKETEKVEKVEKTEKVIEVKTQEKKEKPLIVKKDMRVENTGKSKKKKSLF